MAARATIFLSAKRNHTKKNVRRILLFSAKFLPSLRSSGAPSGVKGGSYNNYQFKSEINSLAQLGVKLEKLAFWLARVFEN